MKDFLKLHRKKVTLLLLIAFVLSMTAIRIFDAPLKNGVCTGGIVSFELAKELSRSKDILNSWDRPALSYAGLSIGIDFLYLLVYVCFIGMLIFNINERLWSGKSFYKAGRMLIVLIFVAAFFDVLENIAMIRLLVGDLQQKWSSMAFYAAGIKFGIIALCLLYLIANWLLLLFKKSRSLPD